MAGQLETHFSTPPLATTSTTSTTTASVTYETSSNVVLENLAIEPSLYTSFYATSSDISADFNWIRKSGLKVNVGVSKVALWPRYIAPEYQTDDNLFMLENPSISKQAFNHFNDTLHHFCRSVGVCMMKC